MGENTQGVGISAHGEGAVHMGREQCTGSSAQGEGAGTIDSPVIHLTEETKQTVDIQCTFLD